MSEAIFAGLFAAFILLSYPLAHEWLLYHDTQRALTRARLEAHKWC